MAFAALCYCLGDSRGFCITSYSSLRGGLRPTKQSHYALIIKEIAAAPMRLAMTESRFCKGFSRKGRRFAGAPFCSSYVYFCFFRLWHGTGLDHARRRAGKRAGAGVHRTRRRAAEVDVRTVHAACAAVGALTVRHGGEPLSIGRVPVHDIEV